MGEGTKQLRLRTKSVEQLWFISGITKETRIDILERLVQKEYEKVKKEFLENKEAG